MLCCWIFIIPMHPAAAETCIDKAHTVILSKPKPPWRTVGMQNAAIEKPGAELNWAAYRFNLATKWLDSSINWARSAGLKVWFNFPYAWFCDMIRCWMWATRGGASVGGRLGCGERDTKREGRLQRAHSSTANRENRWMERKHDGIVYS